jgi:hypothetical protein
MNYHLYKTILNPFLYCRISIDNYSTLLTNAAKATESSRNEVIERAAGLR